MHFREVSTLIRLPPPLRGRVGERGNPRALASAMRRSCLNERCKYSLVFAPHRAAEQAVPLSLTLPRKGGGNPSAGAPLT